MNGTIDRQTWVAGLIGQVIDGYRIESFIGGGYFSLVFEVSALRTNARAAMKLHGPWSETDATADFDNEGTLLQALNQCSNVVNWIASGSATISVAHSDTPTPSLVRYHVMTLATGTLEQLVLDPIVRISLSWQEKLRLWRGAIEGVHQMHLHRIAHRDLKSSNCLLMDSENGPTICVADLGRSKAFGEPKLALPVTYATGCGDTWYAPPEHLWFLGGNADIDFHNADLYGIGSLFVELATGHPMTALAIGSFQDTTSRRLNWAHDYTNNKRKNLAALRPRFHLVIDEISIDLPSSIRQDTVGLIRQLCDPTPTERQPKAGAQRKPPTQELNWLLRRVDILSHRLSAIRQPS